MTSYHAIFVTARNYLYTMPVGTTIGHKELVEAVAREHGLISRVQYADLLEALLATGVISRIPGATTFMVHHPTTITPHPIHRPSLEERVYHLEKDVKELKAMLSDALLAAPSTLTHF